MSDTHIPDAQSTRPDLFGHTRRTGSDDASGLRGPVPRIGRIPLRAEPSGYDGVVPSADGEDGASGTVPGGGRGASGGGNPDGNPLRSARGRGDLDRPCFDIGVSPDGYAWWYVDGISADQSRAISIIGFIGSVFSPWYRWSGRRNPANHCCINVALYGKGGRWTMTDRGEQALRLSEDTLEVGPSSMHWDGTDLVIRINEISTPHCQRIEGEVRIHPSALTSVELPLHDAGTHIWRPFAPTSAISVDLKRPGWKWQGHGYFDANFGTRALEDDFSYWTWARMPVQRGTTCFYDATRRDGSDLNAAFRFDADGSAHVIDAPPKTKLRRSLWALRRETRTDTGTVARQVKPMLDAPFYCRSAIEATINGEKTVGVHEALDLNRFASPLLKPMLAVKVPRRPGWRF